ncbi:hypothetical protein [Heyndrickxia acidicola]|uniref:YxeA family protein n=1 Tax=Heyndrickxia acidicola TaxID=209389 RepID=A0ABU6MP77_9BACI|nr:hypothetical protein [Heyndrickxia acidicola]MED1205438.1 hypothetical protein [Heyndrickxia acidicola]
MSKKRWLTFTAFLILAITPIVFNIVVNNGRSSSTTSDLKVIGKGHSKDYKEYYIKAYDPNEQTQSMAFKIDIDDLNAWNLIEVNRNYIAVYDKTGQNKWLLKEVEHFQE